MTAPKKLMRPTYLFLFIALMLSATGKLASAADTNALVWDAESKDYNSKPGERYVDFKFWFTNVSDKEVFIIRASSTCFCTVAKLPHTPGSIPPGTNASIDVQMDLAGKSGTITKAVMVDSTEGRKMLVVKTVIAPPVAAAPGMKDVDRLNHMQTALADRQAILKRTECASCHADPAKGVTDGAQLYKDICGICHDSEHRASIVPDLAKLNHPTGAEHWRKWITFGRAGSMMPAFTEAEGGPLNDQQIEAIVAHLVKQIPSRGKPLNY